MPDRPRPPLPVAFGAALRSLRSSRGWSQERLAEEVGLHRTYIGGIEQGRRNVSLINIGRLADALEVDLPTLMAEVQSQRG